ncbi:hypothetical protein EMPS_04080 [Entomortierella parvispora]|uniref:RRM domain-containing protein n=1 Tax=Entomortierella parvispora TaxID=205924 RepID=A0A9P3LV50_9FUNG|nr:hypothetical protein EMPS_04080 [Entomortierella parvispora]
MSLKGRQLFVGNIPFSVGWQDLKDLFRQAGMVQRANIMQSQDGRSKGHGIVLFSTIEGADKATEQLNGFMWHGRKLEVREDRGVVDHVPRKPAVASSEDPNALADTLQQKLKVQDGEHEDSDGTGDNKLEGSANAGKDHAVPTATPVLGRTVHVGNIPFRVRWQDLKDLFRKAGRVVRADVALNHDNRSKGHGTVIFSTEDEAKNAIVMFDQYQWQDRILQVQEERPGPRHRHTENGQADTGADSTAEGGRDSHTYPAGRQIFVGNLPFQIQWQDLKDLFQGIGSVIRADIALTYDGRSRGFGSVLFEAHEDAKNAIANFNNHELNGRVLRVHYDRYTPMDGPLVHGAMGPMMHAPHHAHPHAHHQDIHSHRLHHIMHPQHGHGYQGSYHQPQLMTLGNHPMVHNSNVHQFNLGLQPYDGNPYLPSMAALHGSNAVSSGYLASEENSRALGSPLQGDLANMPGVPSSSGNSVVTSQRQFNPDLSATVVSPESPRIASSSTIATTASPGSAALSDKQDSPTDPSQYPFLANLGTIGQLSSPGTSGIVGEHAGPGLGSTSTEHGRTTSTSTPEEGEHGAASLHPQNPYHSLNIGEGLPMRQDMMLEDAVNGGFTPQFYMYPPPHQNQGVGQQLGHHHHGLGSYQQTPGYPTYQDQYSQNQRHHFSHGPHVGVIGSHGNMSLGRGYMNHQSEWMAHPNSFSMGAPPQHMYGSGSGADGNGPLAFGGSYGQGTEGDEAEYNETTQF